MSQLDLALAADVSSRHISFLETGRARPSEDMVLRLAATLEVSLRAQNEMLEAAGFERRFAELDLSAILAGPVGDAVERMLAHHEPFPLVVMNASYDLLRINGGGDAVLRAFVAEPEALGSANACEALFDPRLLRPFVEDWDEVAHGMVSRLHREVLHRAHDTDLARLLDRILSYPDVPEDWRQPDLSARPWPAQTLRLARGELRVGFLSTLTVFSSPTNVTLEELLLESYLPLDARTVETCERLATAS